jgi:hypothetical protein
MEGGNGVSCVLTSNRGSFGLRRAIAGQLHTLALAASISWMT